jgi:hypothetical protein
MQFRRGVRLARGNRNIKKGSLVLSLALFFVSSLAVAQQGQPLDSGSWSGVIISSACTVDEAFAEAAKCTDEAPGAKLVLYDDTIRQIYDLDPPQTAGRLGDSVTVHGTLEGHTIHVASLELLSSIGLAVGQKAPAFSARDQFGQEQTLETLKGLHGTILLFFRSADW